MGETFNNIKLKIVEAWNDTSPRSRWAIGGTAAVCLALIVLVGIWSAQPQFIAFKKDLDPATATQIIDRLEAEGIAYETNRSASEIRVPRTDWNRANLAAGELGGISVGNPKVDDANMLTDPDGRHSRELKQKERELAQSILQIAAVDHATVHISQPEPSPFLRKQTSTKASVIVKLNPRVPFGRTHAAAIVGMVSHAVVGLDRDNVTVLDTDSNVLSAPIHGPESAMAARLEYKQHIESDLAAKAQAVLQGLLGPGRSIVQVAAEVNFNQRTRREVIHDTEAKGVEWERIVKDTNDGVEQRAAGIPGTASNSSAPGTTDKKFGGPHKKETIETKNIYPKTEDETTEVPGAVTRLTVAATVDLSSEDGNTTVTEAQIAALIQGAIGFDQARGDSVEVVNAPLAGAVVPPAVPVAGVPWGKITELVRMGSIGLASLVALIMGFFLLRRMKPVKVAAEDDGMLPADRTELLQQLSEKASQDPDAVSKIIEAWLGNSNAEQDTNEATETTQQPKRAAA